MARGSGNRRIAGLMPQQPDTDQNRGQVVPLFTEPKGIDRYHASSRVAGEYAVKIRNLMLDDGVLVSRLGTDMMGGNAASKVMQVVDLVRKGQKKVTVRFCLRHLEIFEYGLGAWRSFPIPLTGSERDFFAYTGWADKLLFSNGVDGLWEFDFKTLEPKLVPGAPSAKHLTTFGLRVVASSTTEGGEDFPLRVRWTVSRNYLDWTGQGSGYEDLYGSPGGSTDEAMGVFPYSDAQAWLVRSRSTWLMSLSGNVLAPFKFDRILADIGTAYRNTIVSSPSGVIFASRDDIHHLSIGSHDLIGTIIIDDILEEVETLRNAYAAYDVGRQEYRLAADTLVWRFRFVEKGWTSDEYPFPIRSLSRQVQGVSGIPIDNLVGTIDELQGSINDLVYDRSFDDAMMFVPWSTELTVRETDEPRDTLLTGEETDSELLLETGVLNLDPLKAVELHEVHGEYESEMTQQLIFELSFDDGASWEPYSLKDIEETSGSEMLSVKSERVSRKLRLRMRSTTLGKLRLLGLAPILVKVERSMALKKPRPATIEILPNVLNLTTGGTQQLSWRVLGPGGQVITGLAVSFISSNSAIVTVSGTGVVRAVAPGSFSIVASVRNIQVSITGTVVAAAPAPVASVTLTPSISQGATGTTQQYIATLRDANGAILLGRTVVWSSSNPGFATINSSGLASLVTAGTVSISATSEGVTGSSVLTVTASAAVVATVEVVPATFAGDVGETIQLIALPRDAGANVLSGKLITWGTSAAGIATVNAAGLVTFVGAGVVTITATCETVPGTSVGTITAAVVPVSTVTVTPASFTKAPGQTQALTVVTKDVNGNVLVGRAISYSTSNASVATVSSIGVVTAVATGSAVITATSEGRTGTSAVTVSIVPVASVSVSPNPFTIGIGQTQQLVATARDASNNILTGRTVSWGSSDVTKATVDSTGKVTAVAAGSVTITASVETKLGTSVGTIGVGVYSALSAPSSVTYAPSPNPPGSPAELPRTFMNSNAPTVFASTVTLTEQGSRGQNSAKLQQYIDEAAARAGNSRINIANGVQADNPIVRKHAFAGAATLISWPNLPVLDLDTRVNTTDMASAPTFWAPSGGLSAIQFDRSANRTYINGIKFKAALNVTIYDLIFVSPREGGSIDYDTDINNIPEDIVFNQCLVEGNDAGNGVNTGNVRNGVALNARRGAFNNGYIHQISWNGNESKGLLFYNTPGPVKVVNNFIEGASINLLIGGDVAHYGVIAGRPQDIEIRRNHFSRRLQWARDAVEWDGIPGRVVKNIFETKNVVRCLFEGNVCENNWADGQSGHAIVIKSGVGLFVESGGANNGSEDVTVRHNIVRNSTRCWDFLALSDEPDAIPAHKLTCYNNLAYNIGSFAGQTDSLAWLLAQAYDDLYIDHNTTILNMAPNAVFQMVYPNLANPSKRFVYKNNLTEFPYIFSDGGFVGTAAIERWAAPGYVFEHNVSVVPDNSLWAQHPQGTNQYLTLRTGIGFVDLAGGDFHLAVSSPYKGDGEGGTDPGADIDLVNLATSGVV